MRLPLTIFATILIISSLAHSILAVYKMNSKNSNNSNTGFGTSVFWKIQVSETENNCLTIELLNLAFLENGKQRL